MANPNGNPNPAMRLGGPPLNPYGRPVVKTELKELMNYTKDVLYNAMAKYFIMTGEDIKKILVDKDKLPQIDLLVLSCIAGARDRKDIKRLEILFHYILGKPKEVVIHEVEEIRIRLIKASEVIDGETTDSDEKRICD